MATAPCPTPLRKFFKFEESGLAVNSVDVTRTYDIGEGWTHGICIIKNTSPDAYSGPPASANQTRENNCGVFTFGTEPAEASGESESAYRIQFANNYEAYVARPVILNREADPQVSTVFLGRTDPSRRILIKDIWIDGTDLTVIYTANSNQTLDCKLYVHVFNNKMETAGAQMITQGRSGGEGVTDFSEYENLEE